MTRTLLGFETLCAMARNARRARIHNAADSHAAYAAHYHATGNLTAPVPLPRDLWHDAVNSAARACSLLRIAGIDEPADDIAADGYRVHGRRHSY